MEVSDSAVVAGMFENAILYLGASKVCMPAEESAHLIAYKPSVEYMAEQMRGMGLDAASLSEILPSRVNMLVASEVSDHLILDLIRVRRLGVLEAKRRLHVNSYGTKGCEVRPMHIHPSGEVVYDPSIVYQFDNGSWLPKGREHYYKAGRKRVEDRNAGTWNEFAMLKQMAVPWPEFGAMTEFANRVCWNVRFSIPEAPGVLAATDPTGIKSLLKLRDVPDGYTRRTALRHWVKEHWRKNRRDDSVEHQVKEHLRGADKCSWFGLECQILVSRVDEAKDSLPGKRTSRSRVHTIGVK